MRKNIVDTVILSICILGTALYACFEFYTIYTVQQLPPELLELSDEDSARNEFISSKSEHSVNPALKKHKNVEPQQHSESTVNIHKSSELQSLKENINKKSPVVAYAVSFIKCGDHQNNSAGLIDSSLILRHSIHTISSRNPTSGSKYDYKMYAIVHRQAMSCTDTLDKLGFEVKVVDPPLNRSEIKGEFLRNRIQRESCCGEAEFVKLEAYRLPEDIIVHVDLDFAFYKPMDHLFDAIL